jgi:hypothetical protein
MNRLMRALSRGKAARQQFCPFFRGIRWLAKTGERR